MAIGAATILSILSMIGSLFATGFTGWLSYYRDQAKARAEAQALTDKYRGPLTLSAWDLQSRLFGLVQTPLLTHLHDSEKRPVVKDYTCYLIGQYLSWVYIFRRQAQFMRFSNDETNKQLNTIMDAITQEFSVADKAADALMLWRGQQSAIGEQMTRSEDDDNKNKQLYCMGFAEFSKIYNDENETAFRMWFSSIEKSLSSLATAYAEGDYKVQGKARRLQHLLIDLVHLLDQGLFATSGNKSFKVTSAEICKCDPNRDKCDAIRVEQVGLTPTRTNSWFPKPMRVTVEKSKA